MVGLEDSHLCAWQNSAGCWQEVSVPCHLGCLRLGLLECPHNMAASFPQRRFRRRLAVICLLTYPQKSHAVISTIFFWLYRSALFCAGGGYTKAWIPGLEITGEHLGSGDLKRVWLFPFHKRVKSRHRKVSQLSQRHTASVWQSWDLKPGLIDSNTMQRQHWSLNCD